MRFLFLILLLLSSNAFACGSFEQSFPVEYFRGDLANKETFLKNNSSCGNLHNYHPLTADPVIASVLLDALKNDLSANLISKVFIKFNCLRTVRAEEYYSKFKQLLAQDFANSCENDLVSNSYIVESSNGVNLRASPSTTSDVVDRVYRGALVHSLTIDNNWAKVKYLKKIGYIYLPLLKKI